MLTSIEKNSTILFQGDSITDAGRNRADDNHLGMGYAMMAAAQFSALYPEKNITFLNRGISGNRVKDLKARWREDCIDLKPAVLSILIGINDCWRRYDQNDPTSPEDFERDYRAILEDVRKSLKNTKIIIMEPFVLPFPEDREKWREDLDPKIHVVRKLAREYGDAFIPLDGIFAQASMFTEYKYWAADGVHPTPAGHALIAQKWLEAIIAL